ncbi:hypothetical protein BGZ61DRAFT_512227 [Ilyonectria robusta]|uniref:uncharacterized protein n=1 Tax=Ilyonectria robusta TaxID=1079257 RepID=UPI001E8CA559|nr:uncharacterized protein BGZ61DRAFT_512227 [Ilyonectria robusta]KAH8737682.1 hypothetical protein BGZ61DRAFT_512227 [Ilyonectria robusta]
MAMWPRMRGIHFWPFTVKVAPRKPSSRCRGVQRAADPRPEKVAWWMSQPPTEPVFDARGLRSRQRCGRQGRDSPARYLGDGLGEADVPSLGPRRPRSLASSVRSSVERAIRLNRFQVAAVDGRRAAAPKETRSLEGTHARKKQNDDSNRKTIDALT